MLVLFTCCWGSNLSIQAKVGKLNGDLLQPSGIRYEVWSFSVRYLISIAYWKGLISGVKLSVVVPQAIGISLRNRIGDSAGDVPCFYLGFMCTMGFILLNFFIVYPPTSNPRPLFLSRVWGHVYLVVSDTSKVCLSLSILPSFYLFFFLYASFCFTVACTCDFY